MGFPRGSLQKPHLALKKSPFVNDETKYNHVRATRTINRLP